MANQIYELIPKIMGDIGHISKDQTNSFHKYKFRGIDDIYNCVGPVLAKHGVHILPIVLEHSVTDVITTTTTGEEKVACRVVLKVAYRFTAPDGSYVEAVTTGESMDTGDKAASKAMSAAMKYAVWQTLCIPTKGAQGDIENDSHERAAVKRPDPKPSPKPEPLYVEDGVAEIKAKAVASGLFSNEAMKAAAKYVSPETGKVTTMAQALKWEAELAKGLDHDN